MLGLTAATVFLLAFPVKGGGGAMGLDLAIGSMPTGELDVNPIGPFLRGAGLAPGEDPAKGTLHARNQTGVTLSVGINVLPSDDVLGRVPGCDRHLSKARSSSRAPSAN